MGARATLWVAGIAAMIAVVVSIDDTSAVDPAFSTEVVLEGLELPTNVEFAPDGRIFVAEKSGIVKVFDGLDDDTPTVFVDLRTETHNYIDRGLLALELHPDWDNSPYVYVGFTYDGPVGSSAPMWGNAGETFDDCPNNPPGRINGECLASTQVLRFDAATNVGVGRRLVLWDYCEPNRTHSIGDLRFAPDGSLYVSHGEAAWAHAANYGQPGGSRPANTCGDPNTPVGTAPTLPGAEGGMLRSQDLRTLGDPVGMEGTVIRIDPTTAAGLVDNPLAANADPNARRIVAYGLRNPFRFAFRPGTDDLYIADVGWSTFEEINRVPNPPARVDPSDPDAMNADNFGWPCYEGDARQPAFDALNLTICEDLYTDTANPAAAPFITYGHDAQPATGICPADGQASATGLAFYEGTAYPAQYHGALFFTDFARNCLWAALAGPGGVPDPSQIVEVAELPGAVDLESGPGGDLYYVDILAGTINRINGGDNTTPPQAAIDADTTSGALPLDVTFDASLGVDPFGSGLSYEWDLDGNGSFETTTTEPTVQGTYAAAGTVTVTVRVTDGRGLTDTASIDVHPGNSAPTASITGPSSGLAWSVGDVVTFTGTGSDPEDGPLAGTSLVWDLRLHHCPTGTGCHVHFLGSETGATFDLTMPDHEMSAWLEATLTVSDAQGETDTATLRLDPATVDIDVTSTPSGVTMVVNSATATTPHTETVIRRASTAIVAPETTPSGPDVLLFDGWSDSPDRSRSFNPDANRSLHATYTATACNGLHAEAESGEVVGNVAFVDDGGRPGVWAPDGTGNALSFATAPSRGWVDICVTTPYPGPYTLMAEVRGPNGSSNSWWATIDDGPEHRVSFPAAPGYQSYTAQTVTLAAGQHSVKMYVRDDGTYLDHITLVPQGPPPSTTTTTTSTTTTTTAPPSTTTTTSTTTTSTSTTTSTTSTSTTTTSTTAPPSTTSTTPPATTTSSTTTSTTTIPAAGLCDPLIAQAESGVVHGTVSGVNDGGTQAVWSPEGSGNGFNLVSAVNRGHVDVCIQAPTAGSYAIAANVRGPGTSSNSWWMSIDDGPLIKVSFGAHPHYQLYEILTTSLAAGDHHLKFYVREDGTYLDYVTLTPEGAPPPTTTTTTTSSTTTSSTTAPSTTTSSTTTSTSTTTPPSTTTTPPTTTTPLPSDCNGLVAEAESGETTGLVAGVNDGGVQGVWAPEGAGNAMEFIWAAGRGYVELCLSVPSAGLYDLHAVTRGPKTSSNSWWYSIDDHSVGQRLSFEAHPLYQDLQVQRLSLSAGEHTIRFWVREDGTYLDRIELRPV